MKPLLTFMPVGSLPDNFPGMSNRKSNSVSTTEFGTAIVVNVASNVRWKKQTPITIKNSMNNHYNGTFVEPNGSRSQRGYGIEVLEEFAREVAYVEYGLDDLTRQQRIAQLSNGTTMILQVIAKQSPRCTPWKRSLNNMRPEIQTALSESIRKQEDSFSTFPVRLRALCFMRDRYNSRLVEPPKPIFNPPDNFAKLS